MGIGPLLVSMGPWFPSGGYKHVPHYDGSRLPIGGAGTNSGALANSGWTGMSTWVPQYTILIPPAAQKRAQEAGPQTGPSLSCPVIGEIIWDTDNLWVGLDCWDGTLSAQYPRPQYISNILCLERVLYEVKCLSTETQSHSRRSVPCSASGYILKQKRSRNYGLNIALKDKIRVSYWGWGDSYLGKMLAS